MKFRPPEDNSNYLPKNKSTRKKSPNRSSRFNRNRIQTPVVLFGENHYKCEYCGLLFKKQEITRDHVIPKSKGGKNDLSNLVLACQPCNSKKGNKLL